MNESKYILVSLRRCCIVLRPAHSDQCVYLLETLRPLSVPPSSLSLWCCPPTDAVSSPAVTQSREPGWLEGELEGKRGLIPENYVEML